MFSVVEICVNYGAVYVFDLICALFMVLGFVLMYVLFAS